jgi:hypothetical protein
MKFGMDVMPLSPPKNRTFQFPAIRNTSMAEKRTCEVGSTLAPLSHSHTVMYGYRFSQNTKLWCSNSLCYVK